MCPAEKEVPCCATEHCPDLIHGSDDPCYNKSNQYSNRIKLSTRNNMSDLCLGVPSLSLVQDTSYPERFFTGLSIASSKC
jgi:hypothetical protein